ncbi:Vascular endothelial growth factor receptor 1 [Armadillidium vulgare]|nr:Vascular endothelial growth factor receptor 1 [Armadillidium vulgare]
MEKNANTVAQDVNMDDKTHIRPNTGTKNYDSFGQTLEYCEPYGSSTRHIDKARNLNIDKRELWILVEYCRYGNLLKRAKSKAQFINQIDPVTSDIDVGRTSPFPNDPLSPKSLGCSIGYGETSKLNPDAYLESHREGSMKIECQEKSNSSDSENIPGVSAPLTTTDLLCWAWQVANGMEYLTSRKVIHGDLAARNLLLADNNVVKICDFGLSREMMPCRSSGWHPRQSNRRFSAPKVMCGHTESPCGRCFTLGNTPFPGFPLNQMGTALVKGMRLEKPRYCNDQIYSLLLHCWRSNPVERPRFNQIADILSDMLNPMKTKSPMSEVGVILGPNDTLNTEEYIAFLQSQSRPIVDGGYLERKVCIKEEKKLVKKEEEENTSEV